MATTQNDYNLNPFEKRVDGNLKPLGYVQDSDLGTAQGLPSIPTGARVAIIQVTGADVYWTDDGTTAAYTSDSSYTGMKLANGDSFLYVGNLSAVSIIESGTAAILNVSYYA